MNYEELLAEGDPMARWDPPIDEWDSLSLCYTSGTTADPKGAQNGGNHQRECKGWDFVCVFFLFEFFENRIAKKIVTKVGIDMLYL